MDGLELFIDESIRRWQAGGYEPTLFKAKRAQDGTLVTITQLVEGGELHAGFEKLRSLNLLDWSIEAAVLRFPGRFNEATIEAAEARLVQAGWQSKPLV
jgi:hypothetical protein